MKTKKNVLLDTLEECSKKIIINEVSNSTQKAAQDINDNKIIAWFEGESEIGPRALGHRSLLANPTYEYNWERLNLLKTREKWRPFAPAVLLDDVNKYFKDYQMNHHLSYSLVKFVVINYLQLHMSMDLLEFKL